MNNFEDAVNFMLDDVFSWGIKKDKFSKKFSLSIAVDEETRKKIEKLIVEHDTRNPFYNETMYLKIKSLSTKQKEELLDSGRCRVKANFEVTGIYTSKDYVNHLVFKVKGLGKLQDEDDEPPVDL